MQTFLCMRLIKNTLEQKSITSFATWLPDNYLGEGKGYEPDIWTNKDNMKGILGNLGLDLSEIVFN